MFEWADYLRVARTLLAGEPTEAARCSAASRAYYGAFNHAQRYATQYLAYPSLPGADEHSRTPAHLRRHGYAKIAERLDRMRLWRNQCDYHDTVTNLTGTATATLERAKYVIDTLVFY